MHHGFAYWNSDTYPSLLTISAHARVQRQQLPTCTMMNTSVHAAQISNHTAVILSNGHSQARWTVPVRGRLGEGCVHPLRGQDEVVGLVRQHSLSLCLGKGGVQALHLPLALPINTFSPRTPARPETIRNH